MITKEEIDLLAISTIKENALKIFNTINQLQYESECIQMDLSDLSEQDKEIYKNTNYVLLLIKKQLLQNVDYICNIEINSNGAFICGAKIDKSFDINLLCRLCDENEIGVINSQEDGSTELCFYINENKKIR